MSTLLICRRGHQWEGAASQCPECGEASVSALCSDPVSDRDCLPPPPPEPVLAPQAAIAAASARPGDTAPVEPPATPELPGYEILGTLGRGGMGVVYRAREKRLGRMVALKMVLAGGHASPDELVRFLAEAEAVARLRHPNVVQLYEFGQHKGLPFFTLELIEGGSLTDRLRAGPLPPGEAAALMEQVARGVDHAHQAGLVHRDLKPQNVLLASSEPAGLVARVADFGLARRLDVPVGLTPTGAVLGTPSYMAPEQARGQEAGPLADVYALGAILYECLTGRPPFLAATSTETLLRVLSEEPVPPRRLNPACPADLETICLKCLERQPGRRYPSAGALASELQCFLAGQPIQARPVGLLARAGKWVRRRPVVAALIAGLVLVALLGLVGITGSLLYALAGWQEAKEQTSRAVQAQTLAESRRQLAELRKVEADRERARADEEKRQAQQQLDATRRTLFTIQLLRVAPIALRDPDQARRLLLDPSACPVDLRDFAWRHLLRLCQRQRQALTGHTGVVRSVAISPSGKLLASAAQDNTIRLWKLPEGSLLAVWSQPLTPLLLGFAGDDRTLLGMVGKAIHCWDVNTRKELFTLGDVESAVGLAPDGRTLAARLKRGQITLRELPSGKELRSIAGPPGQIESLALSADRTVLALGRSGPWKPSSQGGQRSDILLWDLASNKQRAVLPGHEGPLKFLAFSPDGKTLAAGSGLIGTTEGDVRLWDVASGKPGPLRGRTVGAVTALVFSPDGKSLAASSVNVLGSGPLGPIKIWDTLTGLERLLLDPRANVTWGLAFTPDSQGLASAQADGSVRLWTASAGQERAILAGHTQWIRCLAIAPDGKTIAAGSSDKTISLWSMPAGEKRAVLQGHQHRVLGLAFSPDGKSLASGSRDGTVKLWDLDTHRERSSLPFPRPVTALAWSPDGKTLAVGREDGSITLWNLSGTQAPVTLKGHRHRLQSLAFSPDGKLLASAGGEVVASGEVKLWDVSSGQEQSARSIPGGAYSVAFSRDGKFLAAGGGDVRKFGQPYSGDARVWNTATGKEVLRIRGHTSIVKAILFSDDAQSLITGSFDNTIKIWDCNTGQERATLAGHTNGLQCLALLPDGLTLVSGSGDGTLRLWDVSEKGEPGT